MAALAQTLLHSQQLAADVGLARLNQGQLAGASKAVLADAIKASRALAGQFAVFADFFPAANDEPPITTDRA